MKQSATMVSLLLIGAALPAVPASPADSAKPMFVTLPAHGNMQPRAGAGGVQSLPTWNGSWTYNGSTYNFAMLGSDPSKTNTTTTITTYIVPIRMVYSKTLYGRDGRIFDPDKDQWNGMSVTQALVGSPLFGALDWKWGPTDMGTTQYVDAFQRGSFWGYVSTKTNYHVVLSPTVLSEVTIRPTPAQGGAVIKNPLGTGKVGEMDLTAFDGYLQKFIKKFSQINPGVLPVFLTNNVYLTYQGCCVGGYYSVIHPLNSQIYQSAAYATFVTSTGAFAQDISALSYEIAQSYDDPLLANSQTPCGGELDVGAPLGGKANYGAFNVTYNGIVWHPQAAVFLEYFGAPRNFSANNWLDDQNIESQVCQDGP